jgi:hypothetical protein
MRSELIVLVTKTIEPSLLLREIGSWRTGGLRFQDTVHPLVLTVLLGLSGLNQLGSDAEPDPPDRELREPPQCSGSEGSAVVGADRPWQAIPIKELEECCFSSFRFG